MHELSIAQALIDELEGALRNQRGTRISSVCIRVGRLSGVEIEPLEFVFPLAAEGTPAEGATLRVVPEEVRGRCPRCGPIDAVEAVFMGICVCTQCGAPNVHLEGGRDLVIESMEIA